MEKTDKITMLHGAGGTVMHDLVKNYVVKAFGGIGNAEVPLEAMDDAAVVGDIVLKSDSHAVKPIFFPGGDKYDITVIAFTGNLFEPDHFTGTHFGPEFHGSTFESLDFSGFPLCL